MEEIMDEIREEVVGLSIVVPLFNDEGTIIELYFRLNNVISGAKSAASLNETAPLAKAWEIIFVDNGSNDRTPLLIKELREKDEHIKIVRLIKNFGGNAAIMAGFSQAKGRMIVTIAGDMTEQPEDIPLLLQTLDKGYDVVSGYRQTGKKTIAGRLADWLVFKMTGMRIEGYTGCLRAYRRSIISLLKQCRERTQSIPHLVCWLGAKTAEVEIDSRQELTDNQRLSSRHKGYTLHRALSLASSFGTIPLQIACQLGAWLGGIGLLASMFFIASGLFVDYCGLNVGLGLVLVVLSVQLFIGALIGGYIAGIYAQIQGRPYYIIEEVIE